jgi:hypothetical protein
LPGTTVGEGVGLEDGVPVVGENVGEEEGRRVGAREGTNEGTAVGKEYLVGAVEGRAVVGTLVGVAVVGLEVGEDDGSTSDVGLRVGPDVGATVGRRYVNLREVRRSNLTKRITSLMESAIAMLLPSREKRAQLGRPNFASPIEPSEYPFPRKPVKVDTKPDNKEIARIFELSPSATIARDSSSFGEIETS